MKTAFKFVLMATTLLSSLLHADGYYPEAVSQDQPWVITVSLGEGNYQNIHNKNRKTMLGRLALGNEFLLTGSLAWGVELGVQNGNKMYLTIPDATLSALQWLPVQTNLGPTFDFLVTAKSDPLIGSNVFAELKGGFAYRKWQIEQQGINNLAQLAGEIQAGIGYPISPLASFNLLYQGIFGNDPKLAISVPYNSGHLASIPVLHAVLLGFSVNV
jgi:hypothetical protein